MRGADIETEPVTTAQGDFPRDFWYAALASKRLAEKPVAVEVLDWRLALFRDAEGRPRAVHDRCVHRGAELHLGEVTDGALACRYHGWRYGGDGRCVHIPSLIDGQKVAKGVAVRAFACAETDGYVWTWMGEGPPVGGPTPIGEFSRFNWVQGSLALECAALAAIENNLDWCHPVFAHAFTHGQFFANQAMGFQEQAVEMRRTGRGLTVFAPPTGDAADPIPDTALVVLAFELPNRVTVAFNVGPQGPMRIVIHLVPTGAATCRQEWMASTGPAEAGTAPAVTWTDEVQPIFEQDRLVLESAQRAFAREGHGFERSVEADAPTLLARRIHALACAGRWEREGTRLAERRVIKVRS
ncbi:MAG: aromatic ring-hydroxylating dioxygenase subunit alpha [Pseudomonadota bacterium]|nr:aromatic ring-hydroxylating dioxygenase subunit alpha [Pseudomonadota bacterium]